MLVLVQCPIHGENTADLAPPLGLLRLAQSVDNPVIVLDFNVMWQTEGKLWQKNWPNSAVDEILKCNPQIVGFTSMAIDTHVAIELSRLIKAHDSKIKVLIGGPHMGQIGFELLKSYDCIDFAVQGEAEISIRMICDALLNNNSIEKIPGITYRRNNQVIRNEIGGSVDLNSLGTVQYDYIDLDRYWKANPNKLVNLEFSRGCKYNCKFCYSPTHFGKNPRYINPNIAAKLLTQAEEIGANHAFVIDDNILNDQEWIRDVCRKIESISPKISWSCYGTIPDITSSVSGQMFRANCRLMYVGIDAVDISQQKLYSKKFFSTWENAREKIEILRNSGIIPECAFLLEGLSTQRFATETNIHAAIDIAVREQGLGVSRFNMISTYNGTPYYQSEKTSDLVSSNVKVKYLQDVPAITEVNGFADSHPELFPFHSINKRPVLGVKLALLTTDISFLLWYFPRSLLVLIRQLISCASSSTPFLDWWESYIFEKIPSNEDRMVRNQQVRSSLHHWVNANGLNELKAVVQLEEGHCSLLLASSKETIISVNSKQHNVLTFPIYSLDSLDFLDNQEIKSSILEPYRPIEYIGLKGDPCNHYYLFLEQNSDGITKTTRLVALDKVYKSLFIDNNGLSCLGENISLSSRQLKKMESIGCIRKGTQA